MNDRVRQVIEALLMAAAGVLASWSDSIVVQLALWLIVGLAAAALVVDLARNTRPVRFALDYFGVWPVQMAPAVMVAEPDYLQVWRQVFADLLQARKNSKNIDFNVRSLQRIPVVTYEDAKAQMDVWGQELWATVQKGPPALAAEFYAAVDDAPDDHGSLSASPYALMARRLDVWRAALQVLIDKMPHTIEEHARRERDGSPASRGLDDGVGRS